VSSGFAKRLITRLSRQAIQTAIDSRLSDDLHSILVSYKIRPEEKEIFESEQAVQAHLDGYSDAKLNEYIVAKSKHWLEGLRADEFTFPPHVYSLMWTIQLVLATLGKPTKIIDFGGGAPTIALLLRQLGLGPNLAEYRIIESPAFVSKIPPEWRLQCDYSSIYDGDPCDLLILSSVLPYLSSSLVQSIWRSLEKKPPRFIYFGRTSFLQESHRLDEVFTIQESKFREHGAQVDIGMKDVENNVARYVKRHFKFSEVSRVLEPLGYKKVLSLSDDSGLENIKGLGLYSNNSLWERCPSADHMTHI
jgi:putative methyltransferase (TIGR04325 family)